MRKGVDCRGNQWEERQLFGKMIDITGKHFERLTVLFPVNSNNKKKWLCQCSCGNEVVVGYNNLTMNNTKSCGCLQKDIASKNWEEYRNNKNYIGQQFGRLTVIEFVNVEKNEAIYRFRCTCGNIIETSLHSVKEGNTKSCGCLKKDYINSYKTDIIGKKFGHLLVQSYVGINAYGNSDFKCLCDCGETVIVSRNSLLTKHTQSCGCLRSIGENNIKAILDRADLRFKQQYVFTDLVSDAGGWLPYDFAILDCCGKVIRLIEFDGNQHTKPYEFFGGVEKFLKVQKNDELKNQYALSRNIPLVRIPYSKRDSLVLSDLLGSEFLYEI